MTFPNNISNTFRMVICFALTYQFLYQFTSDLSITDIFFYNSLLKIGVCFTCIISFLNDMQKMLVISNKGFLVEQNIDDYKELSNGPNFPYILIAIVYNPVYTLFYSYTYWSIAHILTISFLVYKILKFTNKTKNK